MVLELAGDRTVDPPVPRVVRTHREFVDQHTLVGVEHLDGEHADDTELTSDPQRRLLGGDSVVVGDPGAGA